MKTNLIGKTSHLPQTLILAVVALISALLGGPKAEARKLQKLNINPEQITISGVSSGAFMAVQMHVTYSQIFSGVGSVAGGIYWCSQGQSFLAPSTCMHNPEQIQVDQYLEHAKSEEKSGLIDPLTNLSRSKVYIFASPEDQVVKATGADKLSAFYEAYLPKENIKSRRDLRSAHGWPTLDYGNPCTKQGLPWLQNCKFDLAGEMLSSFYPNLKNPNASKLDLPNNLFEFEQKEFGGSEIPMFATGWIYIPTACQNGASCALHVTLHGCQMNPNSVQSQFAVHSGFNNWAEANNIVVLYPQTDSQLPSNPYGCWDWYGYTGPNFANKKGPQMQALKKMVDRVSGSRYRLNR